MPQIQKYLVTYTSSKPNEPAIKTYGIFAKKYNQAISEVRVYINKHGLHNSTTHTFNLEAAPSNKKADVEIEDISEEE